MKDKLRLIEMQDMASVAKDNMGNYRRVQNWGYNDKMSFLSLVIIVVFFIGVCLLWEALKFFTETLNC